VTLYCGQVSKVFVIPVLPGRKRRQGVRQGDPRYLEGQRMLVEAMKYLAQSDPLKNKSAIELLSELFRTQFRMSDSPLQ